MKELEKVKYELESQILMDPELKIPNRIALEKDLKSKSSLPGCKLALIDIYRFKAINDTYGVEIGNKVLLVLSLLVLSLLCAFKPGRLLLFSTAKKVSKKVSR